MAVYYMKPGFPCGNECKRIRSLLKRYPEKEILISAVGTPLGRMLTGATAKGICLAVFEECKEAYECLSNNPDLSVFGSKAAIKACEGHIGQLNKELDEYFRGERKHFSVPLDIRGTDFQMEIWQYLRTIPYGEVRSYKDESIDLNRPSAYRAVASANGRNPVCIVIPCHRIINESGALGGYTGGINRKLALLRIENRNLAERIALHTSNLHID